MSHAKSESPACRVTFSWAICGNNMNKIKQLSAVTLHDELRQAAIYQIKNLQNGRIYVGSSRNPKKRRNQHLTELTAGKHHSQKLQNAWNKYGADAFEFAILEVVSESTLLLAREQYWIDLLHAANRVNYNISLVAGATMAGRSLSAEARAKISLAGKGNKYCLGYKHSPEAKARMGAGKVGQKRTPEQRARMSEAQRGNTKKRGWVAPEETRQKLSSALMGNTNGRRSEA